MGKLSEMILKENVSAIVTFIGQDNESTVKAKYVGKDKEDIYPQVIDGADIPKSNIKEVKILDTNTDEERGYKGDIKDTSSIVESYSRKRGLAPVGNQTHVVIGKKVYKIKEARSEADQERLRLAKEKREKNRMEKQAKDEEYTRLKIEKEFRDKENEAKAKELRERMEKEAELEKLRAEEKLIKDKEAADEEAKRLAIEKAEEADRIREKAEAEAKEKVEYKSIVDQNKKREDEYTANKLKTKEFEKVNVKEKEQPRSSGLINTAVRSLKF